MDQETIIVGLGEALWDLLPGGRALGGAPLNVACGAHQLLASPELWEGEAPAEPARPEAQGSAGASPSRFGRGVVASRVGKDPLGDEVVRELAQRGMTDDFVQRDEVHATGTVNVELRQGQPNYDIVQNVAWDEFEFTPAWAQLASGCAAVCFGTLAQRSLASRKAIWQFLDAAPQAVRLLDVNLRQHFYDRTVLEESCRRSTIVKLNEAELNVVAEMVELPAGETNDRLVVLLKRYDLEAVVYTRGEEGTLLVLEDRIVDPEPASYPAAENADAVGAGDACSAGILVGWIRRMAPERIGALANQLGAYVASQPGATPKLPPEILELVA
jgi:fructokinase